MGSFRGFSRMMLFLQEKSRVGIGFMRLVHSINRMWIRVQNQVYGLISQSKSYERDIENDLI